MANKAISELPQAQNVNNQDLFVLEQSGIAKKLTAETFITEQGIINALAEALDGHGGIQSVTLASVSGRIRTYRITFSDGSATTFQVYDGTSIERISRTSSSGLQDTYTIFMSDGTTTFFTVTNGADGNVSEAMLNDALKDKAPAITETASGAIANFSDGADDLVMHNVVVEINPVQSGSGDPSPDNIRPISGWTGCNVTRTGVNIWDEEWELGYIAASTGAKMDATNRIRSKNYIPVVGGQSYFMKMYGAAACYDRNKSYISSVPYTTIPSAGYALNIPENARYILFSMSATYGATYNHDISINYPSTDHDYHAYQGSNTVTVNWQTEAGTVYGGTIDVATGLLTVDRAMVTIDGTGGNDASINSSIRARYPIPNDSAVWNNANTKSGYVICNMFKEGTNAESASGVVCFHLRSIGSHEVVFGFGSSFPDVTSYSQANSWISTNKPVVCYKLATPQTYQLTGQQLMTLLGTNNVWADTGDVSVTYPADTKMYIQNLTQPTEDDLVANQAITSGKYFMIGNSLYLALANIASGAQITIGTNAQRVSLADALNTINS